MARVRERKTRDFNQVKCIKDEREHLLVKEDEIRHRWQEYFDKLFNGEHTIDCFCWVSTLAYPPTYFGLKGFVVVVVQ